MTVVQACRQACTITHLQQNFHPAAPSNILKVSPHVRNLLHDAASCTGMTQSRLKICERQSETISQADLHQGTTNGKATILTHLG